MNTKLQKSITDYSKKNGYTATSFVEVKCVCGNKLMQLYSDVRRKSMKFREIPENETMLEIDYTTGFCADLRCVNIQIASSGLMLVNEDGKSEVNLETNCHKMHFIQSIMRISADELDKITHVIKYIKVTTAHEPKELVCDKSSLIIRSAVYKFEFDALADDDASNRISTKNLLKVVKSILVIRNNLSDLLDKRLSALNAS